MEYIESEELCDGNHRLGALEKLEKEKCHVIIWDDHSLENIMKVIEGKE